MKSLKIVLTYVSVQMLNSYIFTPLPMGGGSDPFGTWVVEMGKTQKSSCSRVHIFRQPMSTKNYKRRVIKWSKVSLVKYRPESNYKKIVPSCNEHYCAEAHKACVDQSQLI